MLRALLPLLFLLPLAAHAGGENVSRPGVLHLTLESAIQMALSKNFSIQVQRFEPRIAEAQVTRERGRFDPRFDLSAIRSETSTNALFENGRHLSEDELRLRNNGRRRNVTRGDTVSTGFSGITPLGTSYDLGIGTGNDTGTADNFNDQFGSNASFSLTQPLLRDFGPTANLAAIRIARNSVLVSEWALRKQLIDTITTTYFVYTELYFAHENLRVAERSRDLALQLLTDNTKRAEIGVMSPLNITTARAEAASRKEQVILALSAIRDNENLLKQLVTTDLEPMLSVKVEIEPPPQPYFRPNVPAGIANALQLRPDYQQALLEIRRRDITLALTKNQALPRLDLTGSLRLLGFDSDLAGSFDRVGRRDSTSWSAGAIFSVPIPNREGQGSVAAAKLSSAQALINLQRLEQQLVVDVDAASRQIITSRERITSTSEASALAQESLAAGEERLRAGAGTTFEVLELQKKLIEAEAAELRARSDYNKAVSEYHRQTGITLQLYRVAVE